MFSCVVITVLDCEVVSLYMEIELCIIYELFLHGGFSVLAYWILDFALLPFSYQ